MSNKPFRGYKTIRLIIMDVYNKKVWKNVTLRAKNGYVIPTEKVEEELSTFIDESLAWPITEYKLLEIKSPFKRELKFKLISPATENFIADVERAQKELEEKQKEQPKIEVTP